MRMPADWSTYLVVGLPSITSARRGRARWWLGGARGCADGWAGGRARMGGQVGGWAFTECALCAGRGAPQMGVIMTLQVGECAPLLFGDGCYFEAERFGITVMTRLSGLCAASRTSRVC